MEGIGEKRLIRVSERGAKIVANHADRAALLREAALLPPIHNELWERYHTADGLAPDATIRQYLVWDREDAKFNEESVDGFIEQFKQTAQFAKISSSGTISGTPGDGGDGSDQMDRDQDNPNSIGRQGDGRVPRREETPPVPKPGMNQATLDTDGGRIVFQYPAQLTPDDYKDVKGWLDILLRKMGRAAGVHATPPAE